MSYLWHIGLVASKYLVPKLRISYSNRGVKTALRFLYEGTRLQPYPSAQVSRSCLCLSIPSESSWRGLIWQHTGTSIILTPACWWRQWQEFNPQDPPVDSFPRSPQDTVAKLFLMGFLQMLLWKLPLIHILLCKIGIKKLPSLGWAGPLLGLCNQLNFLTWQMGHHNSFAPFFLSKSPAS